MLFVNLIFLLGTSDPEANSGQMLTEQCGPQRQIPYMKWKAVTEQEREQNKTNPLI